MRLEPLYRIRFTYPEGWAVGLDGGWQQMFFLAEGRCEGSVSGRFRGANFPQKQGTDGPFRPDFRAVIEADDGAVIMVEWHGYGRAYPPGRRQIVGAMFHLADREPYCRLNDVVCVSIGEVRAPADPGQDEPDLVVDVAELIWEPIADLRAAGLPPPARPSRPISYVPSNADATALRGQLPAPTRRSVRGYKLMAQRPEFMRLAKLKPDQVCCCRFLDRPHTMDVMVLTSRDYGCEA